jgi:hypothetical protein
LTRTRFSARKVDIGLFRRGAKAVSDVGAGDGCRGWGVVGGREGRREIACGDLSLLANEGVVDVES